MLYCCAFSFAWWCTFHYVFHFMFCALLCESISKMMSMPMSLLRLAWWVLDVFFGKQKNIKTHYVATIRNTLFLHSNDLSLLLEEENHPTKDACTLCRVVLSKAKCKHHRLFFNFFKTGQHHIKNFTCTIGWGLKGLVSLAFLIFKSIKKITKRYNHIWVVR